MLHTIFRDDELIVAINGYPYIISHEDPYFDEIVEYIEDKDEEALINLLSRKARSKQMFSALQEYDISYDGSEYSYKGQLIPMNLNAYLASAMDNSRGNPSAYLPVVRFIQRLYKNPSHDTRQRLFSFMDHNSMPIDADGCFLAYKGVRHDYRDKHTGTILNRPGDIVSLADWSNVDTDSAVTCSKGLHACSIDYLSFWYGGSDRIVSVAIAPEHVGAIPTDYNQAKLRCLRYKVVADITDQYLANKECHSLWAKNGVNVEQ